MKKMEENRRKFSIGDLNGFIQLNKARKGSTVAKVDKESISQRKCFLCKENRPADQTAIELVEGWELLVNPFPVFQPHYTIVSKKHEPQKLDAVIACKWVDNLPGMVVFYNDPGAGASAPDHAHYQAVEKTKLPLINLLESVWNPEDLSYVSDVTKKLNLPFKVTAGTINEKISLSSEYPVNAYFWKSKEDTIRYAVIPRKAHRPDFYFLDPPYRRAFSPGAIDMAGVLITPFEEDFSALTLKEIEEIYCQTGFPNE